MAVLVFGVWMPTSGQMLFAGAAITVLVGFLLVAIFAKWGSYWIQAYMSDADVSMASLIVMSLLRIEQRLIVTAKVMGRQSGLRIDRKEGGMSTARLQAHLLAGGDVMNVVQAIIAAKQAGIELNFDRATAIDLAGRDALIAVQTSVTPKVIRCPLSDSGKNATLSAVAKDGVELRVSARVTVRTNLDRLIGGATEETIIARVGQGIVAAIGSAQSHKDVLAMPSQISEGALEHGVDANTAFEIVSIDIADVEVGENIGARLQIDQADADTRIARARAERCRAEAIAEIQQMKAKVVESRASLVLAEAEVPVALAEAFRNGQLRPPPGFSPDQPFPRPWKQPGEAGIDSERDAG